MNKLTRDFVSEENREYKFKFGHIIASSLSGFLGGVIVASLIWMFMFSYFQEWIQEVLVRSIT